MSILPTSNSGFPFRVPGAQELAQLSDWLIQRNQAAAAAQPYGEVEMARSLYDGMDVPGSFDPNWVDTLPPEPMQQPVPMPGDAGPSQNASPTAPVAKKKRGGILGALEKVFMPEPDSLWAAALRGGIWDAKATQAEYKQAERKGELDNYIAEAKLKNLINKGEYQVAGNNLVHISPDGEARFITPPANPSEKERLIDAWRREEDPAAKELMERMLLGGNSDQVLENRTNAAQIRAGATTGAAQIRANATGKGKSGGGASPKYEYKMINGKLMKRRVN